MDSSWSLVEMQSVQSAAYLTSIQLSMHTQKRSSQMEAAFGHKFSILILHHWLNGTACVTMVPFLKKKKKSPKSTVNSASKNTNAKRCFIFIPCALAREHPRLQFVRLRLIYQFWFHFHVLFFSLLIYFHVSRSLCNFINDRQQTTTTENDKSAIQMNVIVNELNTYHFDFDFYHVYRWQWDASPPTCSCRHLCCRPNKQSFALKCSDRIHKIVEFVRWSLCFRLPWNHWPVWYPFSSMFCVSRVSFRRIRFVWTLCGYCPISLIVYFSSREPQCEPKAGLMVLEIGFSLYFFCWISFSGLWFHLLIQIDLNKKKSKNEHSVRHLAWRV